MNVQSTCPTCGNKIEATSLRELREAYHLHQETIAQKLGITRSQWSNIERGKGNVTSNKLRPLSNMLNVSVDTLLELLEEL